MDGQRPPRAVRPQSLQQNPRSSAATYNDPAASQQQQQHSTARPPLAHPDPRAGGVSFQNIERGDRHSTLDASRQRSMPSAYQPQLSYAADPEAPEYIDPSRVVRKKSLVRPDREKIEPGHRHWYYRSHVAQLEQEGPGRLEVMPSCTKSFFFDDCFFLKTDLFVMLSFICTSLCG